MPSPNPRVNMTFEPALLNMLSKLALQEGKSVAGLAKELVHEALERREDLALSKLATLRDKPGPRQSHDTAWS